MGSPAASSIPCSRARQSSLLYTVHPDAPAPETACLWGNWACHSLKPLFRLRSPHQMIRPQQGKPQLQAAAGHSVGIRLPESCLPCSICHWPWCSRTAHLLQPCKFSRPPAILLSVPCCAYLLS